MYKRGNNNDETEGREKKRKFSSLPRRRQEEKRGILRDGAEEEENKGEGVETAGTARPRGRLQGAIQREAEEEAALQAIPHTISALLRLVQRVWPG